MQLTIKISSMRLSALTRIQMKNLGDIIRLLMKRREVTGNKLAADIGISQTSVSKIVTGQSKPRQITMTRLIQRLCTNAEEEQLAIRAFAGLMDTTPDEPEKPPRPIPQDELERVTRYLEVKSMSVAFENDVEFVLKEAKLKYEKHFRVDPFICDFMLDLGGRRVAVDCKYNVNRDWDRTYATVKLLREQLPCDEVIIAIPYENELARKARDEIESVGGRILSLENLKEVLA